MKPVSKFVPSFRFRPAQSLDDSFGAPRSDVKALQKKLEKGWKPHERVALVQRKVQTYASMHGCKEKDLKKPAPTQHQSQPILQIEKPEAKSEIAMEMQILAKVVQDGEDARMMHPAERAVAEYIKGGARDFIDFALDEVDRKQRMTKTGQTTAEFNWSMQAHSGDNPSLRRSYQKNHCHDGLANEGDAMESPADEWAKRSPRAFPLDFVADFSRSKVRWDNSQMAIRTRYPDTISAWRPQVKEWPRRFPGRLQLATGDEGRWGGQDDDTFAKTASQWLVPQRKPRFTTV